MVLAALACSTEAASSESWMCEPVERWQLDSLDEPTPQEEGEVFRPEPYRFEEPGSPFLGNPSANDVISGDVVIS